MGTHSGLRLQLPAQFVGAIWFFIVEFNICHDSLFTRGVRARWACLCVYTIYLPVSGDEVARWMRGWAAGEPVN